MKHCRQSPSHSGANGITNGCFSKLGSRWFSFRCPFGPIQKGAPYFETLTPQIRLTFRWVPRFHWVAPAGTDPWLHLNGFVQKANDINSSSLFWTSAFSRSPSSASHPLFGWEGSPSKIDCRKKGTLILTSLLEDLVCVFFF